MQPNMLQQIFDARLPTGYGGNFYGVYVAQVVDNNDPDGQGRIRIKLPWSPDSGDGEYQVWARLATMMAGNNRGTWFIPDVDDEVLVAFNAGDPRHPYTLALLSASPIPDRAALRLTRARTLSGLASTAARNSSAASA